jgi:hypothetical protein
MIFIRGDISMLRIKLDVTLERIAYFFVILIHVKTSFVIF